MHIPTHQIHNVIDAYARRLKKIHDAANGGTAEIPEDPINAYSVEQKRRLIINKISADIIDRIANSASPHRSVQSKNTFLGPSTRHGQAPKGKQTDLTRYHILTKSGAKISATMKIQDSDFLIKQLEKIARNASEK